MSNYVKGRTAEYRARKTLQQQGYTVIRSAGSKGPCDLLAFNGAELRIVSVKSGAYCSQIERAALCELARPENSTVEIWRYAHGSTVPIVERFSNDRASPS